MNERFLLTSDALPGVALRTAVVTDCEDLRAWKNDHRASFFSQDLITPEGQRRWFGGYLERPDDWMFMILDGDQAVGCMGFRARGGEADVYNVILGRPQHGGKGVVARALTIMCSYARSRLGAPIVARVLKSNPANRWYRNRGFEVVAEEDTHYLVRLADERFVPVPLTQKEIHA